MISNTKQQTKRVKYTEQTAILLSKEERRILEELKFILKGTNSQVFRFALSKLAEELDIKRSEEEDGKKSFHYDQS